MLDVYKVSPTDVDIIELTCPYCFKQFAVEENVVRCPVESCGRWYHVSCWEEINNHCAMFGCVGEGKINDQEAYDGSEEDVVLDDFSTLFDKIEVVNQANDTSSESNDILDKISLDSDDGNLNPTKHIEIDDWEINFANVAKKMRFQDAIDRLGLGKVLGRYDRTEYYWVAAGSFFIVLLIIVIVLLIGGFLFLGTY